MNSQESSYGQPIDSSRRVQKLQAKQVARLEQVVDVSKKVLGYVRVSTEEQASKGHGLDAQERAALDVIRRMMRAMHRRRAVDQLQQRQVVDCSQFVQRANSQGEHLETG